MHFNGKTESEAKSEILGLVKEYCETYHNQKVWSEGDRISYASRVYDSNEMVNLVDSSLEFWLTSGRFTDEFEREFAKYLGVPYCSVVNSGSSANLLAFMTLTSPLLGERAVRRGDEVITVAAGFPTTVTPIIQYGAVPVDQKRWYKWLFILIAGQSNEILIIRVFTDLLHKLTIRIIVLFLDDQ